MTFRNLTKIPYQIIKYRKFLCIKGNFLVSSHSRLLSTKPVNLSFLKIDPSEVTNPTPVIILHGFLGSKQNWRSLGKAIAMKSGRQIYALDARNHGESPHSDYFSYDLMCEDVKHFTKSQLIQNAVLVGHSMGGRTAMKLALAEIALDASNHDESPHSDYFSYDLMCEDVKLFTKSQLIQNAVLVGHSMGGRTAMKLALAERELVDKLVIVDVSPADLPESSLDVIPGYMRAMKEAAAEVQNLGLVQARKVIDEYLMRSIPEAAVRQFLLTNLIERDQKVEWKPNIDVLMKSFHSEIRTSKFSGYYLGESLFICGGNSPYVKEEDHPLIKQLFPKAEFIVVPGAGHWVHSEKPSEFLEAVCNFLQCN